MNVFTTLLYPVFLALGFLSFIWLVSTWRTSGFWAKVQYLAGLLLAVAFILLLFYFL